MYKETLILNAKRVNLKGEFEGVVTEQQVIKPKTKVWVGAGMGFDKINFINNVKAGVLLKTPSDKLYGLDIGFTNVNSEEIPITFNISSITVEGQGSIAVTSKR